MKDEKNCKENKPLLYPDHTVPRTRREFLAAGLIGASGYIVGSNLKKLMGMSPSEAIASELTHGNICSNVPFMCFDAAGGMNIAGGNVMVGFEADESQLSFGRGGRSTDYIRLGLPENMHPSKPGMLDHTYGIVFHSTSGILEGLNSVLVPEGPSDADLRSSIDGLLLCAISADDTNSNPINTVHMAKTAGAHGELVGLLGTRGTLSGGNSATVGSFASSKDKPSRVASFTDCESLISIGDSLMGPDYLNASDPVYGRQKLKEMIKRMRDIAIDAVRPSPNNSRSIASFNKVSETMSLAQGVFDKFAPVDLNPLQNASEADLVGNIFGTAGANGGFQFGSMERQTAAIANLITKRVAGAGTVVLGGYDYHNGTASLGQSRDYQLGRQIGMSIKLAAARGEDMFIHLFTDGGVGGDNGGARDATPAGKDRVLWRGDSGTRSSQLILAYRHGHSRVDNGEQSSMLMQGKKRQIGHFLKAGGVNPEFNIFSNNPSKTWMAVIANYIAFTCKTNDEAKVPGIVREVMESRFNIRLPDGFESYIRLAPDSRNLCRAT